MKNYIPDTIHWIIGFLIFLILLSIFSCNNNSTDKQQESSNNIGQTKFVVTNISNIDYNFASYYVDKVGNNYVTSQSGIKFTDSIDKFKVGEVLYLTNNIQPILIINQPIQNPDTNH